MINVTMVDFKGLDSLRTRDAVKSAFVNAMDSKAVWVDFKNIEFLSRSAAHELLTLKDFISTKNIDVSFINLGDQPNKMLDVVQNSFSKSKNSDFRFVKWLSFKTEEHYKDYLLNL